jgi:NitT/TauT family transport system substrate-binding protein
MNRKIQIMKRVIAIVMVSLVSLATGFQGSAQESEEIGFFLTFVPNVQFAPVYVAIENGYAAENGIQLNIEHGDEPVGVDLIAAERIPFGVISGEQVLLARAAGRPVVYVYEWFQAYPVGVVIPDTSDIETVADLAGKTVGIPGRFGASYSGLTALLGANGMTESDINLEPIGFAAADVVCANRLDAAVVYVNNEPLQIQQRADAGECGDISDVSLLYVSDSADLISNGLVTSEALIAENPALVARLVRVFDQGVREVIKNPARAYLISLDYVENLPADDGLVAALEAAAEQQDAFLQEQPDAEAIATSRDALLADLQESFAPETWIQFQVLLETIKLWEANQLGYSDIESWQLTQDVLLSMGMMQDEIDVTAAFTNEFLPEMIAGETDDAS